MQPRLLLISQQERTITLTSGEVVKGFVNFQDAKGAELIVGDRMRWIDFSDLKR